MRSSADKFLDRADSIVKRTVQMRDDIYVFMRADYRIVSAVRTAPRLPVFMRTHELIGVYNDQAVRRMIADDIRDVYVRRKNVEDANDRAVQRKNSVVTRTRSKYSRCAGPPERA